MDVSLGGQWRPLAIRRDTALAMSGFQWFLYLGLLGWPKVAEQTVLSFLASIDGDLGAVSRMQRQFTPVNNYFRLFSFFWGWA